MKLAFWLLTLIIAAGVIAFAAKYNSGYVLLVAQEYRIELSLNMLLVLLIALFFIYKVGLVGDFINFIRGWF